MMNDLQSSIRHFGVTNCCSSASWHATELLDPIQIPGLNAVDESLGWLRDLITGALEFG